MLLSFPCDYALEVYNLFFQKYFTLIAHLHIANASGIWFSGLGYCLWLVISQLIKVLNTLNQQSFTSN